MNPPTRMRSDRRRTVGPGNPVALFLLKCLAYWTVALWLVARLPWVEEWGVGLTLGTLQQVLGVLHQPVTRTGSALSTAGASVEIVSDCSPHMPFLIFAAVVLAFPASWRQRAIGLALGAVIIHTFNTVRILTLIWILTWRRSWFEFAHVYLWQTGTILIVFATFALWITALSRRPKPA